MTNEEYKRPVRIMIFDERPDCILFYVPEGVELCVPPTMSPFTRTGVGEAFAKRSVRITNSTIGRWSDSYTVMRKAARAERAQHDKELQAKRVVLMKGGTPLSNKRAELIEEKAKVDANIRDLKLQIGKAKARVVRHGEYMPPMQFRQLAEQLVENQERSLAIQSLLGDLKNNAHLDENERFRSAAHRLLPPDVLKELLIAMDETEDDA